MTYKANISMDYYDGGNYFDVIKYPVSVCETSNMMWSTDYWCAHTKFLANHKQHSDNCGTPLTLAFSIFERLLQVHCQN